MAKYIVSFEEEPLVIVANRADAEEYILSLAEADAYDCFCDETLSKDGITAEEYVEETLEAAKRHRWKNYKTFYGFCLECSCYHYETLVPELE